MSDDQRPDYTLLKNMDIEFDNPKQMAFMKRILSIFDNNSLYLDFFAGFRVIIVIEANSYVNIKSSRLLPKFKTQKINSWCAA